MKDEACAIALPVDDDDVDLLETADLIDSVDSGNSTESVKTMSNRDDSIGSVPPSGAADPSLGVNANGDKSAGLEGPPPSYSANE